jgi:biopolymer transport protein ExbD
MKNRYQTKLKIFEGRPDLTPMIDVVFLLLIFFMLSSSFVQVSGIPVVLPKAAASSDMSVDKLVVSIDQHNQLYFNDHLMDWESLTEKLQKCKIDWHANTVIVRADRSTEYGSVVRMMSLARSLGLNVYVATVEADKTTEKVFRDAPPE